MEQKDKTKLIITGVLIFIFILLLANNAKKASNKVKQRRKQTLHSSILKEKAYYLEGEVPLHAPTLVKKSYRELEEEAKEIELKRDPFTLSVITSTEITTSALYLSGIMYDEEDPRVIINDNIAKRGDRIGDYRIVDIKKDSVILNDGVENFELKLDLEEDK